MLSAAPRRFLLASLVCALALACAAVPAVGARHQRQLTRVCGHASHATELITRSGARATCRQAVRVMRAWRRAGNPHRFRSMRCGEIGPTVLDYRHGHRYFATWKCAAHQRAYVIWTPY